MGLFEVKSDVYAFAAAALLVIFAICVYIVFLIFSSFLRHAGACQYGWGTGEQKSRTFSQSTESPIFDASFGQKTGFRARMNEIKSGIPCSAFSPRLKPR